MRVYKKSEEAALEPSERALPGRVWEDYEKAAAYNSRINLYDTVEQNENFFIGKQWEGVAANGLPTPVFNFLKRVTLFSVASIIGSKLKINASPLAGAYYPKGGAAEQLAEIVNAEFESIFESNGIGALIREFVRNAAVDGDGVMHTYFDPEAETGQRARGAIRTEIVENTRVFFGNPNSRNVQKQPYIIVSARRQVPEVRECARESGSPDWESIGPDSGDGSVHGNVEGDDRVTVLLRYRRDKKTGHIFAFECTREAVIRNEWDTGLKLYPISWMSWDYVQDCYHGQALITGLIPNQIFVNKLFAMAMISLMTTAYPKIVYDKTRVAKWDSRVGAAIGVNGGDVLNVARIIDPAQISPQISQFIDLAVNYTQTFLGATDAALGDVRPDNTSAIIALQRASGVPMENTRESLYKSLEDLGRIYLDFMQSYYGLRYVEIRDEKAGETKLSAFDFKRLREVPMSLKLDVGASSYWSETAAIQTLDNLLTQGHIDFEDYLERMPDGYITKKQELIDKIRKNASEKAAETSGGGAPDMAELLGRTQMA